MNHLVRVKSRAFLVVEDKTFGVGFLFFLAICSICFLVE